MFLKETLKLNNNYINSLSGGGSLKDLHLLKILDISYNELSLLPDEICFLSQLTVSNFYPINYLFQLLLSPILLGVIYQQQSFNEAAVKYLQIRTIESFKCFK